MKLICYSITAILFLLIVSGCEGRNEPDDTVVIPDPQLVLLSEATINVPEPSGLAFNTITKTIYTVSDQNSTIYELSQSGSILRKFTVSSIDLEGITFSKNFDTLYVVEESTYQVVAYSLTGVRLGAWKNITSADTKHGYEGITIKANSNFLILNEKLPMLVLETNRVGVEVSRKELTYTSDISDICFDAAKNCFWMVSDESKKILQLGLDLSLVKSWPINATQAEGIAVNDSLLFIVSDADSKFLTYRKPQ